ncbi:SH3 type 3 domain-containing protein [Pseudomonas syringae pv. philadelphi]|uniref:SH3 type 3 domain-containing protein n=3 Tax=Pseudomonas syringae group TaxID=136849 RepID=A0A3M3ZGW4_9PSED|nr:SH3 type 3 domain-containing protein [Pseudomonas syringae pv. philadelphi]
MSRSLLADGFFWTACKKGNRRAFVACHWQTIRPGRSCKTFDRLPFPSLAGPFNEALFSFRIKIIIAMSRHLSALLSRAPGLFCASRRLLGAGLFGAVLTVIVPGSAQAANNERWVSDSLTTYVRSGPTDDHRIVGTLKSGQKVELLTSSGKFSQVRGEGGATVWIPSSDLQDVPGQAERVPQLTQQVAELTEQLAGIDNTWKTRVQGMQETLDARKKLVDELEARTKTLNDQLADSQAELRATQARLGDENKQVMMRYMVYGGSIAGAGLLVGLILPALTKGRKKNDGWV